MKYLTEEEIDSSLKIVDLSTVEGHAINLVVAKVRKELAERYGLLPRVLRTSPIVESADNYDNLYYPTDTVTKSERYTRWIDSQRMLRTQMTAGIPKTLKNLSSEDDLVMLPGIVYRRDVVDKTHVGEPHQLDIWRITKGVTYTRKDLLELVESVVNAVLPGTEWRYSETSHYYTEDGIEVEANVHGSWLEILECGLASQKLLKDSGLIGWSGLALGMGLDRAVMIRKGLKDIRTLRSTNPKISAQMNDLDPYVEVSSQPSIVRDMSVAIDASVDNEILGDEVRNLMGENSKDIEEVSIVSETPYENLPTHVRERLGMKPHMKNVLIRVVIRSLDKTLTKKEANEIYSNLYSQIHAGTVGYTM